MKEVLIKVRNIVISVLTGIFWFWVIIMWTLMASVVGVIMIVDFIHKLWTNRRINWIQNITDGLSKAFKSPFNW